MPDENFQIVATHARQLLDSRGRPTIEAEVTLRGGAVGRAIAPSGASTGRHEAHELRDRNIKYYGGLGVKRAVTNVIVHIGPELERKDARDQALCDGLMCELDGSPNLARLGANATLAVSMAICRAAAAQRNVPLFAHINELTETSRVSTMPLPMTNILSGGAHAERGMDIQDFLVMPVGARDYQESLEMIAAVRSSAGALMQQRGLSVLLADEGGLSPGFADAREALDLMMESFNSAGLTSDRDVLIALDIAASEMYQDGAYMLARGHETLSSAEFSDYLLALVRDYPVASIEDPMDQDDWETWRSFTTAASQIQIVGDDLFATNPDRIILGIKTGAANGVLIKLNQNGTVSGTLEAMRLAQERGYTTIVSARSGETEDSFIADFAVGTGAGQIKIGSLRSSERLAKYNQLARIDEALTGTFVGRSALSRN